MLDPRQFSAIAVTAKKLGSNNDFIDPAEKATIGSFGRDYNIFTNFVKRNMSFSLSALLALRGQ
jgi:hypothetical protein